MHYRKGGEINDKVEMVIDCHVNSNANLYIQRPNIKIQHVAKKKAQFEGMD